MLIAVQMIIIVKVYASDTTLGIAKASLENFCQTDTMVLK